MMRQVVVLICLFALSIAQDKVERGDVCKLARAGKVQYQTCPEVCASAELKAAARAQGVAQDAGTDKQLCLRKCAEVKANPQQPCKIVIDQVASLLAIVNKVKVCKTLKAGGRQDVSTCKQVCASAELQAAATVQHQKVDTDAARAACAEKCVSVKADPSQLCKDLIHKVVPLLKGVNLNGVVGGTAGNAGGVAGHGLGTGGSAVGNGFGTGGSALGTGGSAVGNGFGTGGSAIGTGAGTGGNVIGTGAGTGGNVIGTGAGTGGSAIGTGAGTAGNVIGTGFGTLGK